MSSNSITLREEPKMANMIDYILWRGDLTLKQSPFNYVDSLILSQLSYVLFEEFEGSISLMDAAAMVFASKQKVTEGLLVSKEDTRLLSLVARSKRFGSMMLSGYANKIDAEEEKQFAAITIYPGDATAYVSFRGTDDTLIGWKEDVNMSFIVPVPSQLESVEYLKAVCRNFTGKIRVGGHSKGGNLAVYAATFCNKSTQRRIIDIYNNDGPGFSSTIIEDERYVNVCHKIHTFVPQSSVVGMLLGHEEEYRVVHSTQTGLFQHDPYSWEVVGTDFIYLDQVSSKSRFIDKTLKEWIMGMDDEQKKVFVNSLYEIISVTEAKTLIDLSMSGVKNARIVLKSMSNLDSETRKMISKTFSQLMKIVRKNLALLKTKETQGKTY